MVTVEGHSIPFPAGAGDYPGARAEKGEGGSSEVRVWNLDFTTVQDSWILMVDPDSSEDSRVFQSPELSGRTRDVNFPTSRQPGSRPRRTDVR